jgi:NAD(P)-dependent dehydrogenase (short-subunit alcohol dehydrogenase family)
VIASAYAFVNGAITSSYAVSKAAVEQCGRALQVELAGKGTSAGVGDFGHVGTDKVAGVFEARRWATYSRLRGLVNPGLDFFARDATVRAVIAEGDRGLEVRT